MQKPEKGRDKKFQFICTEMCGQTCSKLTHFWTTHFSNYDPYAGSWILNQFNFEQILFLGQEKPPISRGNHCSKQPIHRFFMQKSNRFAGFPEEIDNHCHVFGLKRDPFLLHTPPMSQYGNALLEMEVQPKD